MRTFSLFELNEHIRRVISLNFPEPVWITAEISEIKFSRQHIYLEVVEKSLVEESTLLAKASAVIWFRQHQRLRRTLGTAFDTILQPGMSIRILVLVEFHERFGFKLIIEEIDPAHTIGILAIMRQKNLAKLQEAGLLERQQLLVLPPTLQRVAVISSQEAAGLQDFIQQLSQNAYGYNFHCRYFYTAVQGQETEKEIISALEAIGQARTNFDAVVIVRGGGAKTDLASFDSFALCKAIAEHNLPVLTGIGHEVDETLADKVAYKSLKTPTAVAEFLIYHQVQFETVIIKTGEIIRTIGEGICREQTSGLKSLEQFIFWAAAQSLNQQTLGLEQLIKNLPAATSNFLQRRNQALERGEIIIKNLDPERLLSLGYTLTYNNGVLVSDPKMLQPGDILTTVWDSGTAQSEFLS